MSYILNALKKAERDRMREEPEDLEDFVSSGWDPYEQETNKRGNYKIAGFIALIAVLLFYGFYSLTDRTLPPKVGTDNIVTVKPAEQQPAPAVAEPVADKDIEKPLNPQRNPVDKQPSIKQLQLPQVTIDGHIYIRSGSSKNRIFIGEKTYYVGDRIDSDWVIESINFDSLSISSGALSSELPLR